MKNLFTQNGFWNGEHTATFTACIIKPHIVEDKPMYWCNVFAGTERQVIEITYAGQTWVIDNETGEGYIKVTEGMGSPSYGHKSFKGYDFVRYIPESEMHTSFNYPLEETERKMIDAYAKEKDPVEFERTQRLIAGMRSFQKMSPMEQIAHINKNNTVKPAPPSKRFHSSPKKYGRGKK